MVTCEKVSKQKNLIILKISPYCFPEKTSSAHLSDDLYRKLADEDVFAINIVPTPSRGLTVEERKKYSKIKTQSFYDGHYFVSRFPMFREGKNSLLRGFRYVLVNVIQYIKCSGVEVDLIFSASTPPTQGVLCGLLKRKLGVPFVYNLQDVFPDSLISAGMTKEGSLMWKIGRKIEDYTYKSADAIIVISQGMKENILAKGVPEEKVRVVYNWVDTKSVIPVRPRDNHLYEELKLSREGRYIVYAGNIGLIQNVELLVEAAKILQSDYPNLSFLVFGDGSAAESLRAKIENERISNVRMFPLRSVEEAQCVYGLGEACVVSCKKGAGTSAMPSKTWSIMAAGRPLLCSYDSGSDMEQIVAGKHLGLFSEAEDVDGFCENVRQLLEDEKLREQLGRNARTYVELNASREVCTQRYFDVIQNCLSVRTNA